MAKKKRRYTHIEYRLALEKIIEEGSQRFIDVTLNNLDHEIEDVLHRMGEFAEVDRSYIFIFSEDGKSMSNTHEWCAPGVEPQIEKLQNLSVENFSWLVEELEAGRNINIAGLEELPPEANNEKEILHMQDIQSLAVVPMSYAGKLKGYLGFDSTKEQVRWNDEDFSLLRTMGDIMVSALVRRRMERQLLQSYKMEALGRFAGGIAHDFNNILTTIKGNIQLLRSSEHLDENEREIVEAVLQGAESGSGLTEQLLNFGRKRPQLREEIHLNKLLEGALQMLERLTPDTIELQTELECPLDLISCDPLQIEQVVMNLVKNSADAMAERGTVTIRTESVEFQNTDLIRGGGVVPGVYVLLQVIDTGCGMGKSTVEKALEPFFTTKEEGKGTGFGLSTAYTIVQHHSGYIEISSKTGEGTTVDVYLPVAQSL